MEMNTPMVDAYFILKEKRLIDKASEAKYIAFDDGLHIFRIISGGIYVEVDTNKRTINQTGKMFSVDMLTYDGDKGFYKGIV